LIYIFLKYSGAYSYSEWGHFAKWKKVLTALKIRLPLNGAAYSELYAHGRARPTCCLMTAIVLATLLVACGGAPPEAAAPQPAPCHLRGLGD
jgi:hypothetical protein